MKESENLIVIDLYWSKNLCRFVQTNVHHITCEVSQTDWEGMMMNVTYGMELVVLNVAQRQTNSLWSYKSALSSIVALHATVVGSGCFALGRLEGACERCSYGGEVCAHTDEIEAPLCVTLSLLTIRAVDAYFLALRVCSFLDLFDGILQFLMHLSKDRSANVVT